MYTSPRAGSSLNGRGRWHARIALGVQVWARAGAQMQATGEVGQIDERRLECQPETRE